MKEERETTNLVELFYSADQVRVAGGVLKVHVIWKKKKTGKKLTLMLCTQRNIIFHVTIPHKLI